MNEAASEARCESRFKASRSERIKFTIERSVEGVGERREAQLLDLSPSGARVQLAASVKFQEAVLLRIEGQELGLDLSISATVTWLRPAGDKAWTVGFSFTPPLPERCIQDLFAKGLLERRRASRRPLGGQATARWESDQEPVAVSLLDISSGGFSLLSPLPAAASSRMLLTAGTGQAPLVEIPARVRWQLQLSDGFAVGCEFVTPSGFAQLREALPPAESDWRLALPERRLSILSLAGIAALVAWYCIFVLAR